MNRVSDNHNSGFTVLEVMIAIFIFGLITAVLVKALGTADRIRGHAGVIMETAVIAQNEAERIRNAAMFHDVPADCTYITRLNKREFEVERKMVQYDFGIQQNDNRLNEIELLIRQTNSSDTIRFRFVQGYTW